MANIISPASDLVGAVDTVVGRLEERAKREDARLRERDDLCDALLDLLHLLRQWERCAELTNNPVRQAQPDGTVSRPVELHFALASQAVSADATVERFGSPAPADTATKRDGWLRRRRPKPSARAAKGAISDVLFIYAPEAEAQLTRAMAERRDAVDELRRALEQSPDGPVVKRAVARLLGRPEDELHLPLPEAESKELTRTQFGISQATQRLGLFIRETFADASQNRVRAPK